MNNVLWPPLRRCGAPWAKGKWQLKRSLRASGNQVGAATRVLRDDPQPLVGAAVAAQIAWEAEFNAFAKCQGTEWYVHEGIILSGIQRSR